MATDFLVACQFVIVSMLGLIIFKVALQLQFQTLFFVLLCKDWELCSFTPNGFAYTHYLGTHGREFVQIQNYSVLEI